MLPSLSQQYLYTISIGLFFKALVLSTVPCQCAQTEIPPVIDLYKTTAASLEVECLQEKIQSLQKQLEEASIDITEKTQLIKRLQQTHQPSRKSLFGFLRKTNNQITHTNDLKKKPDIVAETSWKNAVALLASKEYTKAMGAFQQFLKQHPKHTKQADAYYFLGQLSLLEGNAEKSIQYLKIFIDKYRKDPRIPDAQCQIGLAYYAQQQHAMAYKIFMKLVRDYPNHAVTQTAKKHLEQLNLRDTG